MIPRFNSCTTMFQRILGAAALVVSVLMIGIAPTPVRAMGMSYTAYRADGPATGRLVQTSDFIRHGEKLAIHIKYMNDGSAAASPGWIVFSLPQGCGLAPDVAPDSLSVSVDGGKSFGRLSQLAVHDVDGVRPAEATDVTHVRVQLLQPLGPGAGGEVRVLAMLR